MMDSQYIVVDLSRDLDTYREFCYRLINSTSIMPPKRKQDEDAPEEAKENSTPKKAKKEDYASEAKTPDGNPWNLKIVSWNVDGIRAWMKKDGLSIFELEDPDIVCLQETKCSDVKLPPEAKVSGYKRYLMAAKKDGYSGVALYSKTEPISVKYGFDDEEHDNDGRCITAEYEKFYLVTAYVTNAGKKLVTLDKRMDWNKKFHTYLKELDGKKPVILCGDLNVAHKEIDLKNPKSNKKNAGFTKEERDGFSDFLSQGFVDSYRHFYPDKIDQYTFWTYMMNCRAKNVGWRLDYFVLSERLVPKMADSLIRSSALGSDHCPVTLLMDM